MNPYQIYQQQQTASTTRIDLLVALYDKAIRHLTQAQEAIERQEASTATSLLLKAQVIVYALASGVDPDHDEASHNMLRLYEFVLHCLGFCEIEKVKDALSVLMILREGLEEIQPKARTLELSGKIPPIKSGPALRVRA